MKFTIQELRACLDAAGAFSEHYRLRAAPAQSPRKLRDHFLPIACEHTHHNIEAFVLDVPLKHGTIYGSYCAEAEGFSILLAAGMNEDQIRFVLCKEIFHAILHDASSNITDVCDHLDGVAISFPVRDSEPALSVKSEFLAEIAAMEFLFPYEARVTELAAAQINYAKIAEKYLIPQYLVEIYLHETYMSELGAMVPKG